MNKNLYVAIVSFGEQSSQHIAHMLNSINVKYDIVPHDSEGDSEKYQNYTHVILSGGPKHVYQSDAYVMSPWIIKSTIPVLGICYGMQIIAHTLGGTVTRMNELEKGPILVSEIINNKRVHTHRWMNRYDRVITIPQHFTTTGITDRGHVAAMTDNYKYWCVQYHPESDNYTDVSLFVRFLKR